MQQIKTTVKEKKTRQVNFKMTEGDYMRFVRLAGEYTGGDLTAWATEAIMKYRPPKRDLVEVRNLPQSEAHA